MRMLTGMLKTTKQSQTLSNNLYSALAALNNDEDDVASPPSTHASPALTKAQPATAGGADAGKS